VPAQDHVVLGMMSGSSLDGLDLALCRICLDTTGEQLVPEWEILAAETDTFPRPWQARLRAAPHLPGRELWRLHADLGHWIGQRAKKFMDRFPAYAPTLAGSHGHTIFHDPSQKFTTQIGDGAAIAMHLGIPTVTEFRGSDVAFGGQGAPLAPLADKHLFPEYDGFLNLGGIVNLSLRKKDGDYIAGDITGCCQILDRLATREGLGYDAGGQLAAQGSPAPAIAQKIAVLPFHQLPYPKSLGNAWVRESLWPMLDDKSVPAADLLHTFTRWLAKKIAYDLAHLVAEVGAVPRSGDASSGSLSSSKKGAAAGAAKGTKQPTEPTRILLTGGGIHNHFLVEQLRGTQDSEAPVFEFIVPDAITADFKEAALIALAALLRVQGMPNALPSATGAPQPTVNGAVYYGQ
jgi:anhydro-N-acetylmuramic acid kinase